MEYTMDAVKEVCGKYGVPADLVPRVLSGALQLANVLKIIPITTTTPPCEDWQKLVTVDRIAEDSLITVVRAARDLTVMELLAKRRMQLKQARINTLKARFMYDGLLIKSGSQAVSDVSGVVYAYTEGFGEVTLFSGIMPSVGNDAPGAIPSFERGYLTIDTLAAAQALYKAILINRGKVFNAAASIDRLLDGMTEPDLRALNISKALHDNLQSTSV